METAPDTAYLMGQLLSLLVTAGWADNHAAVAVTNNLRGTMLPAIARAGGEGASQEIADLVLQIGEMPHALTNERQSRFWLGFYHRRAGRGGDRGGRRPKIGKQRHIKMADHLWEHCSAQAGGAAAYLRRLAEADRQANENRAF